MKRRLRHIKYSRNQQDQEYFDQLAGRICGLVSHLKKESRGRFRVLDIGCGRGELLKLLSQKKISCAGIDIDPECIRLSQKYGEVLLSDVYDLEQHFKKGSFPVVVLSHVLEHLENPTGAIEKVKRISSKWLIVIVPNLKPFPCLSFLRREPHIVNPGHLHGWDANHLLTFLEKKCSLRVKAIYGDNFFLIPFTRLRRVVAGFGPLTYLENIIFPKVFPLAGKSLIYLCQKN